MVRWFCVATCFCLALSGAASADTVTLRNRIEANGAMVTLGDVFQGAGALAGRPIAPAPAAGQVGSLPMAVLTASASAAGLDFTPPAGVNAVAVVHPAGARATIAAASTSPGVSPGASTTSNAIQSAEPNVPAGAPIAGAGAQNINVYSGQVGSAVIRRGDAVMLIYQSGGVTLTMRTQAMQDAAIGQSVRLLNPASNRVVLGVVTGPAAASASP